MVTDDIPSEMGCEEFALFQQEIPGLFIFLGKDKEGEPIVPIHDPEYIFNDEILTVGGKSSLWDCTEVEQIENGKNME